MSGTTGRLAQVTAATGLCGILVSAAAYATTGLDDRTPQRPRREVTVLPTPVATAAKAAEPQARATASPEPPIPSTGSGKFSIATGTSRRAGRAAGLIGYRVEVEEDLPVDVGDFARDVERTLSDDRGWTKTGHYAFQRNEAGPLRIILATRTTTDRLCAPLETRGEVSCRNGNVVAINAVRWSQGARSYGQNLRNYRRYVINHEVGHSLGLPHARCPSSGAKAPVMLQQTIGLDGCEANPWP